MTIQGGNGPKSPTTSLRANLPREQTVVAPEKTVAAAPNEKKSDLFEEGGTSISGLVRTDVGAIDAKELAEVMSARRGERSRSAKHEQRKELLQQTQTRLLSEQQALQHRANELFHTLVEMDFAPEARESLRTEMDRVRHRMGKVRRRLGDIRRKLNATTLGSGLGGEIPPRRASRNLLQEKARVGSVSDRGSAALALARQSRPRNPDGSVAAATWVDVSQAQDKLALGSQLANWNLDASVSQQIAMQLGWPGGLQADAPSCSNGKSVDDLTSLADAIARGVGSSAS